MMKYIIYLGIFIGLYVVGRMVGNDVAAILVDEVNPEAKLERKVTIAGTGMEMKVNLAEMRDAELPQTVRMIRPVAIPIVGAEGMKRLAVGDEVTLKNRNGEMLIVESLDQMAKGEIPIDATDIFDRIAKARFESLKGGPAVAETEPEKPSAPETKEKEPASEPKKPDPVPDAAGTAAAGEMPDKAKGEPATEEPAPKKTRLSEDEIVTAMQDSIKKGELNEFKFDQVIGWKAGEDEQIDGVSYQIGHCVYKTETIFGVRQVQAKALFLNGQLEKWVYTKTGMQIPWASGAGR